MLSEHVHCSSGKIVDRVFLPIKKYGQTSPFSTAAIKSGRFPSAWQQFARIFRKVSQIAAEMARTWLYYGQTQT